MAHQTATALTAAAVTDQELVAAPGESKQIVVYGLHVSADIKQTVSFESGSDLLWRNYVAADTSADHESQHPLFRANSNGSLTITTGGAGNTFIAVQYRIEPDSRG